MIESGAAFALLVLSRNLAECADDGVEDVPLRELLWKMSADLAFVNCFRQQHPTWPNRKDRRRGARGSS